LQIHNLVARDLQRFGARRRSPTTLRIPAPREASRPVGPDVGLDWPAAGR
jgi:hypothetical protein